jgi:hypothetical protein
MRVRRWPTVERENRIQNFRSGLTSLVVGIVAFPAAITTLYA